MEYYDTLAAGYDELHGEEQRRKLAILKDYLKPHDDALLLDVGCGTGMSSDIFNCRIIGIDNSQAMLREGKRKERNNADYLRGKGENLPFKDRVFDHVISVTALHNFTDPKRALGEIKRVCRKNGAVTVLKKAKGARDLEALVDEVLGITDLVDGDFDRLLFFNIQTPPQ